MTSFYKNNTGAKIFIMYYFDDPEKILFEQRKSCLTSNSKKPYEPHLTLFQIEFNTQHHLWRKVKKALKSSEFGETIQEAYNNVFYNSTLIYNQGGYTLLGHKNGIPQFFAKDFGSDANITLFRMAIYNFIQNVIRTDEFFRKERKINGKNWFEYCYPKTNSRKSLFVVPGHSHGVGVWTPHITICHIQDLKPGIRKMFDKCGQDKERKLLLLRPIWNSRFQPFDDIKMDNGTVQVTMGRNVVQQIWI